jgi:steroid delta-isomerase-like uncharacterized protein
MGESKDLLNRGIEAWNRHDAHAWTSLYSQNTQVYASGGVTATGPEAVQMVYTTWQEAFPDNQVKPRLLVEEGETTVLEATFEGTHTGTLNAPSGAIPATGKRVSIPYVLMSRARDGKMDRVALYFDQIEVLTQLGLMQGAAAAAAT